MGRLILKKIISRIPLFLGITFLSFAVIHLSPGAPGDASGGLDMRISSESREKLVALYGLDEPILKQYHDWLMKIVRLDLGVSYMDGQKVLVKIGEAVPITLLLQGTSLFLVLLIGVWVGLFSATHRDRWQDKCLSVILIGAFSVPSFWLAVMMMSYFGVALRLFPVSGLHSLFYETKDSGWIIADMVWHMVLPVFVASLAGIAAMSRYMRTETLRILKENFVLMARAKGLSDKVLMRRHVLRNALLPIITILGLSVPGLLGGSVLLETIFSIPGMGRLFYSAVFTRDYPVIMGVLVLGAFLTLLGNLIADIAYLWVDPRIRRGSQS